MRAKLHERDRLFSRNRRSVASKRKESTKFCRMQTRFLQHEKVENWWEKCMEMWKTLEKPLKNGRYHVENPVDAVDNIQC